MNQEDIEQQLIEINDKLQMLSEKQNSQFTELMLEIKKLSEQISTSQDYVDGDDEDELYEEAREAVIKVGKASTSLLQRKLRIGYGRACRLIVRSQNIVDTRCIQNIVDISARCIQNIVDMGDTHLNLGGESCPITHDQIITTPISAARLSNGFVPVRLPQKSHGNFTTAGVGSINGWPIAPTIRGPAFARLRVRPTILPGRTGGYPTGPPTVPYVNNSLIRFLSNQSLGTSLAHHFATRQGHIRSGGRFWVSVGQTLP
jgi:hypothetical protein